MEVTIGQEVRKNKELVVEEFRSKAKKSSCNPPRRRMDLSDRSLGPPESAPNGISIGSAIFAGLANVTNKQHIHTSVCCTSTLTVAAKTEKKFKPNVQTRGEVYQFPRVAKDSQFNPEQLTFVIILAPKTSSVRVGVTVFSHNSHTHTHNKPHRTTFIRRV